MKGNKTYYKKKIYHTLFIITLICAFQGFYEYYRLKIDDPLKLLSAVVYGTIKVFLFVSPVSSEEKTNIMYEFAKWMAPILTSTFVFNKISDTLFHVRNMFFNKLSKNHILVFENSLMGETLINNILSEKSPYKISLITRGLIDDNIKSRYEKKGIATYRMDFQNSDVNEIKELFNTLNINNVRYMFFCADTDMENYALYTDIVKRIKPKKHITCYVKCESKTVSGYMEEMISFEREKEVKLKNIDTVHFDQRDLTVRMLVSDEAVSKSISDDLDGLSHIGDKKSVELIDAGIKKAHVLIIGINELTLNLLKLIANDMTLSLKKDTRVSIIDSDAAGRMKNILLDNEELKKALDIQITDIGQEKILLQKELKSIKEDKGLSLIFLMNEDVVENLRNLKLANMYFENVPKIIRNVSNIDLSHLLPKNYGKIKVFGDVSQIMTDDVMIRESLDKRAKRFNQSYNDSSEAAGMGEGQKWNELSYVKKTSSRLSASHARVKEEIIRKIFSGRSDEDIKAYLNEKFEEFTKIQEIRKEDPNEFKNKFRKYLSDDPLLDFLSRLEHKRWCNSYYSMNFKYSHIKDENAKTHPCLIDDWEIVIGEKFDICHPEYDLLSIFTLFQMED